MHHTYQETGHGTVGDQSQLSHMLSVWAEESVKRMQYANQNAPLPSLYHPSVESTRWPFPLPINFLYWAG